MNSVSKPVTEKANLSPEDIRDLKGKWLPLNVNDPENIWSQLADKSMYRIVNMMDGSTSYRRPVPKRDDEFEEVPGMYRFEDSGLLIIDAEKFKNQVVLNSKCDYPCCGAAETIHGSIITSHAYIPKVRRRIFIPATVNVFAHGKVIKASDHRGCRCISPFMIKVENYRETDEFVKPPECRGYIPEMYDQRTFGIAKSNCSCGKERARCDGCNGRDATSCSNCSDLFKDVVVLAWDDNDELSPRTYVYCGACRENEDKIFVCAEMDCENLVRKKCLKCSNPYYNKRCAKHVSRKGLCDKCLPRYICGKCYRLTITRECCGVTKY